MTDARIELTRKPRKCPNCGGVPVATILYGLPRMSAELRQQLDTGRIVLGGCMIPEDAPRWRCTRCGQSLHVKVVY